MPVRIGRVSSREAERATRAMVSVNACAGIDDDLVAAGLGQRGEVLGAQRADVEARGAGDDLDVLLRRAQLERDVAVRQLADHVEQQAGGKDDRARCARPRVERDAEGDLHVGGAQLDVPSSARDLDAGERLDGTAGRRDARDDLQLVQQLLR